MTTTTRIAGNKVQVLGREVCIHQDAKTGKRDYAKYSPASYLRIGKTVLGETTSSVLGHASQADDAAKMPASGGQAVELEILPDAQGHAEYRKVVAYLPGTDMAAGYVSRVSADLIARLVK